MRLIDTGMQSRGSVMSISNAAYEGLMQKNLDLQDRIAELERTIAQIWTQPAMANKFAEIRAKEKERCARVAELNDDIKTAHEIRALGDDG